MPFFSNKLAGNRDFGWEKQLKSVDKRARQPRAMWSPTWPLMAVLVAGVRAGTDGAMPLYYEQQMTTGWLDKWQQEDPRAGCVCCDGDRCQSP